MRVLGAVTLMLIVTLAVSAASGATGRTALTIAYQKDGRMPGATAVWTLRCDPAGGTHPHRARACRGLARVGWPAFRPTPPDVACTEIYGGPQTALVSGVVAGQRVWTRLRRENGCEIARWDKLAEAGVLPPFGLR